MWKTILPILTTIYSKEGFTVLLLCVLSTIFWFKMADLEHDVKQCYDMHLEHVTTQNDRLIKVLNRNNETMEKNNAIMERLERKLDSQ